MTKLDISPELQLPEDAVTRTFGILAMRGAGKSNAAVVMAEEMYDAHIPWVAVDPKGDWWGIRSTADGKGPGLEVPIFGGEHGDVPLEPAGGAYVADLVAEQRVTLVLDLSDFSKGDQIRFLTDFAERLFRRNREPLHLFLDEADEYVPQRVFRDAARLVGAFSKLVKQGRNRGLGITVVTQRSAVLNKDVLTQLDNLIPMRTTAPQDRKAILAWVEHHALGREIVEQLPTLEDGEAWVWSPYWLKTAEKIRWRRRRTFDSGATPELGKGRPSARLADIDLGDIKDRMADTIERAKEADPKQLRRRIAALEKELLAAANSQPAEVEKVDVPVLDSELVDRLDRVLGQLTDVGNQVIGAADAVAAKLGEAQAVIDRTGDSGGITASRAKAVRPPKPAPTKTRPASSPRPAGDPTGDVTLRAGERKMLDVLASRHPLWVTKAQLGTLSKFKPSGGTFRTYLGVLRSNGLADVNGKEIRITDRGLDLAGGDVAQPQTTEELLDMWRSALRAGERAMLDQLVAAYPDPMTRDQLAEAAGFEPTGGTFRTYLGVLRGNGLVDVDGDQVRASDTLFLS